MEHGLYYLGGFNSKLVRLEAFSPHPWSFGLFPFQFQIGAIRGGRLSCPTALRGAFQFQIGAIRGKTSLRSSAFYPCFNSKLVRLEGQWANQVAQQYGCFNSKLVRLEGAFGMRFPDKIVVSIPNWCD